MQRANKNRITLAAVAAVAALGACRLGCSASPYVAEPPALRIHAAAVDELELAAPGSPMIVLARGGNGWRMRQPTDDAADDATVMYLLRSLEAMSIGQPAPSSTGERAAPPMMTDANSIRVVPKRHGIPFAVLHFSRSADLLRIDGQSRPDDGGGPAGATLPADPPAYSVRGFPAKFLSLPLSAWRDRRILDFDRAATMSIETTVDGRTIVMTRIDRRTDQWVVTAGAQFIGGTLDEFVPRGLADNLSHFSANGFGDGVSSAQAGLDNPRRSITAVLASGERHTLVIGNDVETSVFVRRSDSPRIFRAYKSPLGRLFDSPSDWRTRSILKVDPLEISKVEIVRANERLELWRGANGAWNSRSDPPEIEQEQAAVLVANLSHLSALSIADPMTARRVRFNRDAARVKLTRRDGNETILSLSAEENDRAYARVSDKDDTFVISRFVVDQIIRRPMKMMTAAASPPIH